MEEPHVQTFPHDIKVTIDNICTVVPARPTPTGPLYLSNIDLTVMFPVETVYVYSCKPTSSHDGAIADRIRGQLGELLVHYYVLAGRFKFNQEKGRMEIDCNGMGVMFVTATSLLSIEDLGEIGFVNPTFRALVANPRHLENPPIVTIQVTTFKCGGFAFGLHSNHAIFDGLSCCNFLCNLAAMVRGQGIQVVPTFDRTSLAARSPPKIEYEHPEMMEMPREAKSVFTKGDVNQGPHDVSQVSSQHAYRSVAFSSDDVRRVKERAMEGGRAACSTFEAMVAHVWQARVRAMEEEGDGGRKVMVLFAVDIRRRVEAPGLAEGFCGNGVMTAYAEGEAAEVRRRPLSYCAGRVQEGIRRVTAERIRSTIDCIEVHRGIPAMSAPGNFYLSAWWKLAFHTVDFGAGQPIYAGPILTGVVDMILLISNCSPLDDGLNVLAALPPAHMAKFERYLHI